jgi:heterodisulfide reductase subunit B
MAGNRHLMAELNGVLAKEDLHYTGTAHVKHYLSVLYEEVGVERLKNERSKAFSDLNIAVIQGCHVLRPREITLFDEAFVPKITEELLLTTGAKSLDWRGKLECCGAALAGINNELSHALLKEKIIGAQAAGADFITPICSYCHLQFDTAQKTILAEKAGDKLLPVLLFPQLLGLCLGIDERVLGIAENSTITPKDIEKLHSILGPPVEEKKKKKAKVAA